MSLMITILSETGTLSNGRPRITGRSFHVSPTSGFTQELAELARFGDEFMMLDADCSIVEIDPEGLRDLRIEPDLEMINGQEFGGVGHHIAQLLLAQEAAGDANVRVMIEASF